MGAIHSYGGASPLFRRVEVLYKEAKREMYLNIFEERTGFFIPLHCAFTTAPTRVSRPCT